jgi:hypothetical protein
MSAQLSSYLRKTMMKGANWSQGTIGEREKSTTDSFIAQRQALKRTEGNVSGCFRTERKERRSGQAEGSRSAGRGER